MRLHDQDPFWPCCCNWVKLAASSRNTLSRSYRNLASNNCSEQRSRTTTVQISHLLYKDCLAAVTWVSDFHDFQFGRYSMGTFYPASLPTATSLLGRKRSISDTSIASPASLSAALCEQFVKGSSGSCGWRGKTFQRKMFSSISSRALQIAAAVRSAIGVPLVCRSIGMPHLLACADM